MPNESSFQSLYLIKRDLTSNPQLHPLKEECLKIFQGKSFAVVTSVSPKKKKIIIETHSNYWNMCFSVADEFRDVA